MIDPNLDDANNPASITQTEGDGAFEEGELLADSGNRLDFFPKLSLPAQFGIFEALAEGGLRETLYFPNFAANDDAHALHGARRPAHPLRPALRDRHAAARAHHRAAHRATRRCSRRTRPTTRCSFRRRRSRAAADRRRHPAGHRRPERPREGRVAPAAPGRATCSTARRAPRAGRARRYGELTVGTGYDFHEQAFTRLFATARLQPVARDRRRTRRRLGSPGSTTSRTCARRSAGSPRRGAPDPLRLPLQPQPGPDLRGLPRRAAASSTRATRDANKINQIDLATYIVATRWLELFADGLPARSRATGRAAGASAPCSSRPASAGTS